MLGGTWAGRRDGWWSSRRPEVLDRRYRSAVLAEDGWDARRRVRVDARTGVPRQWRVATDEPFVVRAALRSDFSLSGSSPLARSRR